MAEEDDLKLLRRAERALAEIDRTAGLEDRHADVLAALRIRIEGVDVAQSIKQGDAMRSVSVSERATD